MNRITTSEIKSVHVCIMGGVRNTLAALRAAMRSHYRLDWLKTPPFSFVLVAFRSTWVLGPKMDQNWYKATLLPTTSAATAVQ